MFVTVKIVEKNYIKDNPVGAAGYNTLALAEVVISGIVV
jgi:hypothetical protein